MEECQGIDSNDHNISVVSEGKVDEAQRLLSLHSLGILDSDPNPMLDGIVNAAAGLFKAPIALVSLVDERRQWFKARMDLNGALDGVTETPRDIAFCNHAIEQPCVMTVSNPKQDTRFSNNPFVTGPTSIRFYCGAPLRLPNGEQIGCLCVLDTNKNSTTTEQEFALEALSGVVVDFLLAEADAIDIVATEFPQQSEAGDMQGNIMNAAFNLMATEGAGSFSVRKVARDAEITLGHLQHYFPDKLSLLRALVNGLSERFKQIFNDDIRALPNPVDRLTACARGILEDAQNPGINKLMNELWAISSRDETLADDLHKIYADMCDELTLLMADANPELTNKEAKLRAATCISLLTGFFLLERLQLVEGYRDRTLEKIISMPFAPANFL